MGRATGWPPMSDESSRPAGWSRFATVRSRLTLLATALVLVMLVVSSAGLVGAQRSLLIRGIDEALGQRSDNLQPGNRAGHVRRGPAERGRPRGFVPPARRRPGRRGRGQRQRPGHGRGLGPGCGARAEPSFGPSPTSPSATTRFGCWYGGSSRAPARTLVAGKNLDDVDESVRILTTSLTLAIPVVVTVLGFLVWWLTGRVLRPVESIRSEVASIQGTELHRRVPVPGSYDEISRLARTMNEMLDRVEHAIDQQRRFVADASHELRSPLTRIRSDLEVGIAYPHTRDPDSTYRSLLADTIGLQGSGRRPALPRPVGVRFRSAGQPRPSISTTWSSKRRSGYVSGAAYRSTPALSRRPAPSATPNTWPGRSGTRPATPNVTRPGP